MVVEVIAIEERLHGVPAQQQHILLELLVLLVFPVFVDVFLVEVVFLRRDEGRLDFLFIEILPGVVAQPRVVLHLGGPVQAEAVYRFALDHLVDEVGRLDAPAARHLVALDLDLLGEDVVSDLLARLAHVGPPTEHALEGDHADREVVHSHPVVLTAHNFGCHVARRPRGVLGVVGSPLAGDPKVRNADVPCGGVKEILILTIFFEDEVLWLNIAVDDILVVDVLEARNHTGDEEACVGSEQGVLTGLLLGEAAVAANVVA